MSPLAYLPYIIGIALLTVAGWFTYGAGEAHTQVKWDAATKTQQDAAITQLGDNQVALEAEILKRKNAEAQHDIDQGIIDSLADNIARSVPVHFPTACRGAVPSGSIAGTGQDGSAGVLSAGVDAAFAEFQKQAELLIVNKCADENIDAIRLNQEIRK